MTELIIIKTNEGEKIKQFLQQEHISYEIYQEGATPKKISEEELGKAYQEVWKKPSKVSRGSAVRKSSRKWLSRKN